MTNVTVNGFTAVHAGSNGTLTTSDTCLNLLPVQTMSLSIEMFKGTETGRLTPEKPRDKFNKFCRHADIFDPTSIIDNAERD